MVILPGRGALFIHIPKTGGTSMTLALEARARADDIFVADTPKAQRRKHRLEGLEAPGRLWKHARLSDLDGMSALPDPVFIFTLVRNPWSRMVSLYNWAQRQSFQHPLIATAQSHSFDAFLKDAGVQVALRRDRAIDYVTDRSGRVRCDAFVRLEHLTSDLAVVQDHLGCRLDLPHANRAPPVKSPLEYTSETRAIVADIFADDIQRFGYLAPG